MPGNDAEVVGDEQERGFFPYAFEQFEYLCLDRHVECRRRLVGDQHVGARDERGCDHDPLAHPARELVRIGAVLARRIGQPDTVQHVHHAPVRFPPVFDAVTQQYAAQLFADRHVGVEGLHRVLEHHADPLRAQPVQLALGRAEQFVAVEDDAAADRGLRRQQAHDRERRLRLSGPRFTDEADRLAGPYAERKPGNHVGGAVTNTQA